MVDLQVHLQVLGLPKSGLKETLIQRLHEAMNKMPQGKKAQGNQEEEHVASMGAISSTAKTFGDGSTAQANSRPPVSSPDEDFDLEADQGTTSSPVAERETSAPKRLQGTPSGQRISHLMARSPSDGTPTSAQAPARGSRVGTIALARSRGKNGDEDSSEKQQEIDNYLSRLKRAMGAPSVERGSASVQRVSAPLPRDAAEPRARDRASFVERTPSAYRRDEGVPGRSFEGRSPSPGARSGGESFPSDLASGSWRGERGGGLGIARPSTQGARKLETGPAWALPTAPVTAPGATAKPRTLLPIDRPRPARPEGQAVSSSQDSPVQVGQWLPRSSHPQVQRASCALVL